MHIPHFRMFLNALRTAILIVAGFIAHEILVEMEAEWNKLEKNNEMYNFTKSRFYKLFIIFLIDLSLLYIALLLFKIEL